MQLCGGRIVSHPRGISETGMRALVDVLDKVATMALSVPSIGELDLNPIVVSDAEAVVVDAACVTLAS